MPRLIEQPTVIEAASNKPKRIEEYAGCVNTGHARASVARMVSPEGWGEPGLETASTAAISWRWSNQHESMVLGACGEINPGRPTTDERTRRGCANRPERFLLLCGLAETILTLAAPWTARCSSTAWIIQRS